MKKLTMVLGVLALLFSFNGLAQELRQERGKDPELRMDKQLTHMKTMLDLTDEQYADIENIFKKSHSEMKGLKSAAEKAHEARKAQAKAIKEDADASIKAVLSAEQQLKFEAMHELKEERHDTRKRMHGDHHDRK